MVPHIPSDLAVSELTRRLEQEHKARLEAEAIGERRLRELYKKQEEIALLHSIATAANKATRVQDALRDALALICEYTKWPLGHALLVTSKPNHSHELISSGVLHLPLPHRFRKFRQVSEKRYFASGICLPGRILATGQPLWITDVSQDPAFLRSEQAQHEGLKSAFGCPILIGMEVVAVLEFFTDQSSSPDEGLLKIMTQVGSQVGHVIKRRRAEERLIHSAFHDPVTSLPNRALFHERLQFAANRAKRRSDYRFAVLSLDLDRSKPSNGSVGHLASDQLVIEIAQRLTACLRRTDLVARNDQDEMRRPLKGDDTIARVGGDQFTILLEDIHDIGDPVRVADRIQEALKRPLLLAGEEVVATASIGVAISTPGYTLAQDILHDADIAMYRGKTLGKAPCEVFDAAMRANVGARLKLEGDLRRALERNEFRLYYQPIVRLASKGVQGFEALLRWQHPQRGILLPAAFVPIAEETDLILFIGKWVLREACRQMRDWQQRYPKAAGLAVSVNISAKELAQRNLLEQIAQILRDTGVNPHAVRLELTERAAMANPEHTRQFLMALKQLGLRLSVDDFRTDYCSLSYLRRFAIDTLKIDRSFITHIDSQEENRQMVRTIMLLAADLGMDVIAEGVETGLEVDQLKDLRCEYVQGDYLFRPMKRTAVESLILDE